MPIPTRTRAAWVLLERLQRRGIEELTADEIPAFRGLRARAVAAPSGRPLFGRPHPAAPGRDIVLPTPQVSLPARVFRPAARSGPLPVVVNFHGGGFVFGDPRQSQWLCSHVAAMAGVLVVSVDYRMAPEHPYPTPLEDCYAATCWVAAHAGDLGGRPGDLAVLGDSAGGNLATVVALMARDRSGPAIARQALVYPATEMVETMPSERALPDGPVLSAAAMHAFSRFYLGDADPTHPYASPLRADLRDLPPALVQTAQYDPLKDQGSRYARRLSAAGVPVRLTEYQGAVHGFLTLPGISPCARQAVWEVAAFLARHPA